MTSVFYNDDVERMVNPRSARNQHKTYRRIRSKLTAMAVLLAVVLVATLIWAFTGMDNVVFTIISAPCTVVAAFLGGQVWEVAK